MEIISINNITAATTNNNNRIKSPNQHLHNNITRDTFTFKGDPIMKDILQEMQKEVASITGNKNFKYPQNYIKKIMKKEFNHGDWTFLTGKYFISSEIEGLKKRFNIENLVPLAVQEESQLYACLNTKNQKIEVIDAFATDGNILVEEYKNYDSWIKEQL